MNSTKKILKTKRIYENGKNAPLLVGVKISKDGELSRGLDKAFESIEGQDYACQSVKEYLFGIENRPKEKGVGGCLVFAGAPAVGKTVMAESVAKAMHRPFLRIDMGTKNDKESGLFELLGIHPSYKSAEEGEIGRAHV